MLMKFGSDSVSSVEYLQYLSIRFSPSIFLEFYSSGIKKLLDHDGELF